MRRKPALFLGVALGTVVLDQATKLWVQRAIEPYAAVPVLPNLLDLTHVMNPGAAFGILARAPADVAFLLFVVVGFVAIGAIVFFWPRIPPHAIGQQVALALILGGVTGNLIDRLRFHAVVDFIDLHWFKYHWPTFNAADASICVGLGLVALALLRGPDQPGQS